MAIGISPLVDYAFKLMLGSPEHSGITVHFLNAILIGQPKVTQVTFLNPILDMESDDDKLAVLDILATDEHGRRLNIEMQTSAPLGMSKRLTYYLSSSYSNQLGKGESYQKLVPSISICVLSQALFHEPRLLYLDFQMRNFMANLTLNDNLQVHLLQLKHLQVTAETVYNATPAEQWAYFLKNAETMTLEDVRRLFPDRLFDEAIGVLQMISKTEEQMLVYNARLKQQRDEEARTVQAVLQARMEGEAAGEARGIEIGEARGEARGQLRGQIGLIQKLLGQRVWTTEEFAACDLAQLTVIAEQLEQQLKSRHS
jgi:predicted transposase/invertase (TIGR01784 family)